MEPLGRAKIVRPPVAKFIKDCIAAGFTREQAKLAYNEFTPDDECWRNDEYVVLVRRGSNIPRDMNPQLSAALVWLSIRRDDRKPVTSWRHLQQIKNELIGKECEAVMLCPAESRLVDGANQYHLFGYDDKRQFPFGFPHRSVSEQVSIAGSVQEPFTGKQP